MEDIQRAIIKSESKWLYAQSEYILGNIYLQIVQGTAPISLSIIVKNIGFLVKNVPFAGRKAEIHFRKAIESAKQMGAKGILGQAYLDLGLLYKIKKRKDEAKKYLSKAISLFEECEVDVYLKKANEALEPLR
jgi:tetratricopeptide (TPR) repeat protein